MSYENITYAVEGPICRIAINRESKMNALNHATITELGQAFDAAKADGSVRALILTGTGPKAFVAGADIGELRAQAGNAKGAADTGSR